MAMVAHHHNPSCSGEEIRMIMVVWKSRQIVQETISQKYPRQNGTGRVDQEVKCLSSKYESQSSKQPNQNNNKKEESNKNVWGTLRA
jgi:hypothetical protein